MATKTKLYRSELGRRLVYQGPRPPVTSQAGDDKCTTGKNKPYSNLNIIHANVCGLKNKKVELANIFASENIHIACLQETIHLNLDTHITGYTAYSCKCNNCRGITTYVRNDVTGGVENVTSDDPVDCQKITVWHEVHKYTIFNVYNPPPNKCTFPFLTSATYAKTIVLGDFNGHSPQWGYPSYNPTGKAIEEICNTTNLSVLQNRHSPPTLLHRASKTLSRPDLTIISADLLQRHTIKVLWDIGSDHRPIMLSLAMPSSKCFQQRTRWNFKKANWDKFREETNRTLPQIPTDLEVDEHSTKFTEAILQAASNSIPRGYRKKFKPFWNEEIQKTVEHREKCRIELEKTPTQHNQIEYKRAAAIVKLTVKKAKKEKWHKTVGNLDLQRSGAKAWSLISNLCGEKRQSNLKPIVTEEETITNQQKKAEAFNKHFAAINKSGRNTPQDRTHYKKLKSKEHAPKVNISLFEEDFTESELNKALKKLKAHKSPGPDKIHNEMLCNLGFEGKMTLLELINKTWREDKLPKSWRCANITPILKKGKPAEDFNSYRPISLTSCISKIAERMVNYRLCWWLETNKLLDQHQAGFRPGQRTGDQLFHLCQSIFDGFQKQEHTIAIFVDLQQAYDRVWRKGLLWKMLEIGVHGKIYKWIKNFLTDRLIQTKCNNGLSSKAPLEEGLPQGSALSCTLFLIYINDLPKILDSKKALYADDLTLWHTSKSHHIGSRRLNEDLQKLHEYCQTWKLKINCKKTVYTVFTKSNKVAKKEPKLKLGDTELSKTNNPTYLGIELDEKLSFKNYVSNLKEKATKRLNLLKRLASTTWGADKNTLRQLYIGYVRSALDYNMSLLTTCSKTRQSSIDKIQNQAVRFISGAMRSTSTAACQIHANIEPLKLRREAEIVEMVERFKRNDENHPNRRLVDNWTKRRRLKQKSLLDVAEEESEKHHLPENREKLCYHPKNLPPNKSLKKAHIETILKPETTKSSSDPLELKEAAESKIENFKNWIIVYTDGSAFKGTHNAGYGARIEFPDNTLNEVYDACGSSCGNFEAEAMAIEASLHHLKSVFNVYPEKIENIAIFSDSMSVLQSLENEQWDNSTCRSLGLTIHDFLDNFKVRVVIQWIPGHTNIAGNERADTLAKRGSSASQPLRPVSQQTVKQIIKTNKKEVWLNEWARDKNGRALFKHMPCPKTNDAINNLRRKEQSVIFRLRSKHIPLNHHLNRITADTSPTCPLCLRNDETVNHILFECPAFTDIRHQYLPTSPNLDNTLYADSAQLKRTCSFFAMVTSRRVNTSSAAGSDK